MEEHTEFYLPATLTLLAIDWKKDAQDSNELFRFLGTAPKRSSALSGGLRLLILTLVSFVDAHL